MPSCGPCGDDGVLAFFPMVIELQCLGSFLFCMYVFHVLSTLRSGRTTEVWTCMRLHAYRLYITIVRYGCDKKVSWSGELSRAIYSNSPDSSKCATI